MRRTDILIIVQKGQACDCGKCPEWSQDPNFFTLSLVVPELERVDMWGPFKTKEDATKEAEILKERIIRELTPIGFDPEIKMHGNEMVH